MVYHQVQTTPKHGGLKHPPLYLLTVVQDGLASSQRCPHSADREAGVCMSLGAGTSRLSLSPCCLGASTLCGLCTGSLHMVLPAQQPDFLHGSSGYSRSKNRNFQAFLKLVWSLAQLHFWLKWSQGSPDSRQGPAERQEFQEAWSIGGH